MSYSEGGPSNGFNSKRLIDTWLKPSESIPIGKRNRLVSIQGLALCGSVTAGRQI